MLVDLSLGVFAFVATTVGSRFDAPIPADGTRQRQLCAVENRQEKIKTHIYDVAIIRLLFRIDRKAQGQMAFRLLVSPAVKRSELIRDTKAAINHLNMPFAILLHSGKIQFLPLGMLTLGR